jgi:catechol 2,3-dioxygenase-like lactoylglutathione lyase family enzyme
LLEKDEFPTKDMELTQILVVGDLEKSKQFYLEILGATLFREYGGTSCVVNFQNVWLLLVTESDPTLDKPGISFQHPNNSSNVSHSFTIRVKDCQRSYEILNSRGAKFLTPPYDWGAETRAFFRDPDGHLFEISEYKEN